MTNLIRLSIERPIAVVAAVLMVVMFGALALQTIPVQLAPDVRKPVITIFTNWFGAAPAEIEREIINRQEEMLKGLEGVGEIISTSQDGRGEITLEFRPGQNMDKALLLTANRLDRVNGYPDEVDEPILRSAGSEDNPIAWIVLKRQPGNNTPIHQFGDFAEDVIRERLERTPGVSRVNVYGGSERELRVIIDPHRMARYGLTASRITDALRNANISLSAGKVDEGKRSYVVRTEGELTNLQQVRAVVLVSSLDRASGRMARITVGDIAEVAYGYKEAGAYIRHLGKPAIAINAVRETGANVIETMAGLRAGVAELNAKVLPRHGLSLTQVYDETVYIDSAIELVQRNIYVGGSLAALILLLFLRSFGATLVVSVAIPVSVVGSFVAMAGMGRSINVISLAGLAFAVGMVVDAAIVVLENIYRLRQQGMPAAEAAYHGAGQVWGAVLVSTLTTVMVFIPLLTLNLEIGQLFRDIAVAISVSVVLSLIGAITIIPALAARLLRKPVDKHHVHRRLPVIDSLAGHTVRAVLGVTNHITHDRALAPGMVTAIFIAAVMVTWLLLPKLEYLPEGNRNLVFGIILPPPGYNLETTTRIAEALEKEIRPVWVSESGSESAPGEPPKIDNFFFVATRTRTFLGASSVEPERVGELIPVLQEPIFREPGTFGFITQPSIFGRGIGGGRSVNLDISGADLETVLKTAQRAATLTEQALPRADGNQLRPLPGLELGAPEVRVIPDRVRLADSGISARELGLAIDTFNDGMRVVEITVEGKRIDLTLRGPEHNITETQGIAHLPVVLPGNAIVPVSSLSKVVLTAGPTAIRHRERVRTVTLEIRPASGMALESAMEIIRAQVIAPLQAEKPPPNLSLSGTADKLTETWDAMVWQLAIAVIIVYLVMTVLFESFLYPIIIIFSVPLATAGAVLGLAFLNRFSYQPLDMLTLLGFVILIGIVVNNAILLVHQTLHHIRADNMSAADAIQAAVRHRIRPIFMSTLTSIFGMLPLVLFPGAGSELYRGLGTVVVSGLALSAILTLAIVPPLLRIFLGRREANV
ncbi:MAG: efflux RND transporter permease subunit [Gammaproteobacteria bacterium]|nr:efflux RND transporter permease subunit [Gammaproteobacteria bacterium]